MPWESRNVFIKYVLCTKMEKGPMLTLCFLHLFSPSPLCLTATCYYHHPETGRQYAYACKSKTTMVMLWAQAGHWLISGTADDSGHSFKELCCKPASEVEKNLPSIQLSLNDFLWGAQPIANLLRILNKILNSLLRTSPSPHGLLCASLQQYIKWFVNYAFH